MAAIKLLARQIRLPAKAAHVVTRRYVISRVYADFMEPRGAIGVWDPGDDRFTLCADVQRDAVFARVVR